MANSKQAAKRSRRSLKSRERNRWQRTRMSTYIKRVLSAVAEKNLSQAQEEFRAATSVIDRLASKGIIHKNKAARHKSRLNARVKHLALEGQA